MITVKIKKISYYHPSRSYAVILEEIEGDRSLPVLVGAYEAQSIAMAMELVDTPRPLTHDLIVNMINEIDGKVSAIKITKVEDGIYFSNISIHSKTLGNKNIDSRPSDALAIALRMHSPILVAEEVMSEAIVWEEDSLIIEDDIKLFVSAQSNQNEVIHSKKNENNKLEYAHSEFGEIEIKDIPRVKKLSSKYLVNSWTQIPHVTNHDEADITEMEEFRVSLTDIYTGEKKKITPLAFIIKALVASLRKFPNFNCSIHETESEKIILKKYFHIGIAVDTPHGLMVPKIRNVNNKNLNHISEELKIIGEKCRNLKIDKKEFFGGSMTITSLGSIGGSFFTPIINYPEVAILGIGRATKKQISINGKFYERTMLPMSLSYDHRIIDGAEAAKFNNELKENLGKNFAYKLAI